MRIQKILNNNAALTLHENESQVVVLGKGICFQKQVGDIISPDKVEKEFILKDDDIRNQFQSIVAEVPYACVEISKKIIDRAKSCYGIKLNENIYVTLTDHIYFAIQRVSQGLEFKNTSTLWDVPWLYPEAYKLGQWGRELIEDQFSIEFSEEEGSFLALHIITAEMSDNFQNVLEITKIVPDILHIIQFHFNIHLSTDDIMYYRLITHLKFFAQRVTSHSFYNDNTEDDLFFSVKEKYPDSFVCVQKISLYIEESYHYTVTQEEQLYLTVHIERLLRSYEKKIAK